MIYGNDIIQFLTAAELTIASGAITITQGNHKLQPESFVKPGVSTEELNRLCHEYIVNVQQAIPAPLNYGAAPGRPGFPKSICTSGSVSMRCTVA